MSPSSEPAAGFDPCVSWGCGEHVHEPLIQSTLITTNIDLEFVNDLATSYECSKDGMTWTFTLRDDAKFSDGQPLTAADVAFTINTINASETAQADLSMVKEAVALDGTTVELRMAKPNNALLYTLAVLGIVPEHAYGKDYGAKPVGSGRYLLEQWDQGQQIIFKANPDYYGDAPLMERVVVVFMEEDAAMAAAKAGEVDIAYTSALLADNVPDGYELFVCESVDSRGISLPTRPAGEDAARVGMDGAEHAVGNDVTCDLAMRRALNYGVDRDAMIKNVLNGYGTKAYSVGDGMPWASEDMKVETDVAKAKKILDEGGWKPGKDGIREKDGVRAAFDLLYASGDSVRQALAYEFANQMKALGVEVTPKGGDWDTDLYPAQFTTPILWGWGSNAPVELYELTYSTGWGNVAAYDSKDIDKHLDAALAAPSVEESYEHYKLAQWDEKAGVGVAPQGAATWVWLANVDHLYFKRSNLKVAQQKPHPHGHGWSLANNVDQWTWSA
ncbi:MAG: ABC transporter substrate-binding protein [Coriobacteriia bacterium]|nr:ABC transporter substrate-binding protein [Coriobacteriia bacterium]